jgi:aryl-alcohol dehydrogenase-like predicted oxidoreductase
MRYQTIPKTDIAVSALSIGAGPFGTRTPRDEAFRMLDYYVERGGNFIDTAHIYAAWVPDGWGISERTVGEWVRSRDARSQIVVGPKAGIRTCTPCRSHVCRGRRSSGIWRRAWSVCRWM